MGREGNYFRIGVFVICAVVFFLIGIFMIGGRTFFKPTWMLETYFNTSVQGIDVGSPVKYLGVRIGEVKRISFVYEDYSTDLTYVMVQFSVDPRSLGLQPAGAAGGNMRLRGQVEEMVKKGLRIKQALQGLTGVCFLDTSMTDPSRNIPLPIDWVPACPYIPSTESSIQRMETSLDELLRKLSAVDYARLETKADEAITTFKQMVTGELSPTLQSLRTAAQTMPADISRMSIKLEQVIDQDVRPTMANIKQASVSLPEIMVRVNRSLANTARWAEEKQPIVDDVLENLRVITANFAVSSELLRSYPSLLLFGEPPPRTKIGGR